MTAPFASRALTDLASTLETTAKVTAMTASGTKLLDLEVETLAWNLDEAWAPSTSLSLTAVRPEDPRILDPRKGVRIVLELGYKYMGGSLDQHVVADLLLVDWTSNGDTVQIVAVDDALILQEWVPLTGSTTYAIGTRIVDVITALLGSTIGVVPVVETANAVVLAEPLTVGPTSNVSGLLASLADQADVWLRCDPLRVWRVTDRPRAIGASVVQVTTGAVGITTEVQDGMSRVDWANAVSLEFDGQMFAFASHPTGDMGTATVGIVANVDKVSAPWPGTLAATQAAQARLDRAFTRGDAQSLTALAAWWVRPGDTITTPDLDRVIVSKVTFTFPDSLMRLETRKAN